MVAVMDSRLQQAQALAEALCRFPSAWQERSGDVAEVKPDVVSVSSLTGSILNMVMAALEAGCHVMCEKPPAMTPRRA
ncbi:Gfo/Idh/MocA family oxidoreductase [Shigella flexneri]